MEIITTVSLININATLVVLLASFLLFLAIMNRIMFRPLRGVAAERHEHMQRIKSDIEEAEQSYAEISDQIKREEAKVRASAFQLMKEKEEQGVREAGKMLTAMREEITAFRVKNEAEVQEQLQSAQKQVQTESENLATVIMEKMLDRRLTS